jgi:hypothetical protein
MRIRTAPFTFLAVVLGVCLYATPAAAQATRTWVSGVGDDANPCSRTAPCKTFAGAISKTAAGGEINVLDPGGFGGVTITKSISIISKFEAGVLVSGTNAIIVNVGVNDSVVLDGLDIEGLGTGLNGVTIVGGGKTMIRNCTIHHFSQAGVNLVGTNARVFLMDSNLLRNNIGVNITTPGAVNFAAVQGTVIDLSTASATQVTGGSTLQLSTTTLSGSPASITNSGGIVISYGNNIIRNSGAPTMTVALQ